MKFPRYILLSLGALVALGCLAFWAGSRARATAGDEPNQKQVITSNQAMMRDKLTAANKVLEGLAVEDFKKVAENAERLRIISRAASWHVVDSEEYARRSKDFQQEAADLKKHAEKKNLEGATMDYVRMTMTCVECHKHLREKRPARQ
jgi:hypothetical protein